MGSNHLYIKVIAEDGTTLYYDVTVTRAATPSSDEAITAFSLAGAAGTINEAAGTIAVTVPYGTDVTNLIPTFSHAGASITVNSAIQTSGTTAQDFINPVTYTVTAQDGSTKNYTVTVTVAAAPQPPTITTTTLPGGKVGTSYNQTLAATGNAPITWTLDSGNLPGGLSISGGVISGTPTAAGTFSFTVKASNTVGDDTQQLSITINAADSPAPNPGPTPTYTRCTLTDAATGVTVTGSFTAGATLVVANNSLHAAGTCAACDEIRRAGGWVALHDISITGSHSGNEELSIPVPSGYNGQSMTVWHCKSNHVEKVTLTASNGYVTGTFSSLSPFAVFATNTTVDTPDDDVEVPQTGDNSNMGGWVALLVVSLLLMGCAVWQYIRQRRRSKEG